MYIIHVHGMANVLGHHCDYGDVIYFGVFLAGNIAVLSKDLSGQKLNWESRRDVIKLADFISFWLQRTSNLAKIVIETVAKTLSRNWENFSNLTEISKWQRADPHFINS